MIDLNGYKKWLEKTTNYTAATIGDIVSRLKRANGIYEWFNEPVYLFDLENQDDFKRLSCSVKSQIRKSVRLYFEYIDSTKSNQEK